MTATACNVDVERACLEQRLRNDHNESRLCAYRFIVYHSYILDCVTNTTVRHCNTPLTVHNVR